MFQPRQNCLYRDDPLGERIKNIREIISRINDNDRRSQSQFENDWIPYDHTFTTQESVEQNNDDSKLLQNLRRKLSKMKLPLNQVDLSKQLSIVIEESVNQSGRTNPIEGGNTGRQVHIQVNQNIQNLFKIKRNAHEKYAIFNEKKGMNKSIRPNSPILSQPIIPLASFYKSKSASHIQSIAMPKIYVCSSKQKNRSKFRKGLSVLSKQNTKEFVVVGEPEIIRDDFGQKYKNKLQIQKGNNAQEETKTQESIGIKIGVLGMKKSINIEKGNENKITNNLTRTNIRQFYMSKRIKK